MHRIIIFSEKSRENFRKKEKISLKTCENLGQHFQQPAPCLTLNFGKRGQNPIKQPLFRFFSGFLQKLLDKNNRT